MASRQGFSATAQDVGRRILGEDVTEIDYTTERIKRMVGKVHLQRHYPLRARQLHPARGGLFVLRAEAHHRADGAARERTAIRS